MSSLPISTSKGKKKLLITFIQNQFRQLQPQNEQFALPEPQVDPIELPEQQPEDDPYALPEPQVDPIELPEQQPEDDPYALPGTPLGFFVIDR